MRRINDPLEMLYKLVQSWHVLDRGQHNEAWFLGRGRFACTQMSSFLSKLLKLSNQMKLSNTNFIVVIVTLN